MQVAVAGHLRANAHHAGDRRAGAHRADGGGVGVGHVAYAQLAGALGKGHLQRGHDEGRDANVARRALLLQQLAGDVVALVGVQFAQRGNQRLQWRGQATTAGIGAQGVEQGVEHALPRWVDVLQRRQQRHRVFLRLRQRGFVQRRGGQRSGSGVLRVDDCGDEVQVVGNRVALGQLAHTRSALGKQAGGVGQHDALKVGAIDGFDFARLKNALHGGFSQKIPKKDRRHALKSVSAVSVVWAKRS